MSLCAGVGQAEHGVRLGEQAADLVGVVVGDDASQSQPERLLGEREVEHQLAHQSARWELLVHHLIDHLRDELARCDLAGRELSDAVWTVRCCVGGFLTRSMDGADARAPAPSTESIEAMLRRTLTAVVADLASSRRG